MYRSISVIYGKVGHIGQYRWTDLQRIFKIVRQEYTDVPDVLDLEDHGFGEATRQKFDCVKILFHPCMINYYGRVATDGLKNFTFDTIDQVANGLESMGVPESTAVFDNISDRMGHLIGNIGDLRKFIAQTTSSKLQKALQQKEQSLMQVKFQLLHELALDYQNKPLHITLGNQSMVDMFDQLWSIPTKTPQVLQSLSAVLAGITNVF